MPIVLTLGLVWLISQIVTDLVQHSDPNDYLRGWSKILLCLVNITVLWAVVCGNRRRFILYGVGIALGGILTVYIDPSDQMLASPWKFGLAGPVTVLVVIWAARSAKHRYLGIFLPLFALAVVNSFGDTRSLALLCLLTAVYSVLQMYSFDHQRPWGLTRLVLLSGAVGMCVLGFTLLYSRYAQQGTFGEYAQHKLEGESGKGGILLGGRSEILASGQAILDSPILGHGSWARDPIYAAIMAEDRAKLGYKDFQSDSGDDLIPAHSHIFGAWVEAGLAGAVFWLYVLGYAIRSLMKVSGSEPLLPLFAFAGCLLVWDILFSPISPDRRFITPYFITAMIVLRSLSNHSYLPARCA